MRWLFPTLGYVAAVGSLGVTSRLALRHLAWPALLFWTAAAYVAVAVVLMLFVPTPIRLGAGVGWGLLSGLLASLGLVALYIALGLGQASRVIPVAAAYPAFTVVLAALFLRERVTLMQLVGIAIVIAGVAIITLSSQTRS